jgi:predicted transglutaminase-like cysteine proteinase
MRTVAPMAAPISRPALRLALAALIAALALNGHAAVVGSVLPSFPTATVHAFRPFLWTEGPAVPTRAWAAFCNRLPSECQIDRSEPSAILLTLATWEAMVAVNGQVNATIKAQPDRLHWGVDDRWDYPDDGIGDCEDIQLLKRRVLVEQGLPRRALRMAVVFDEVREGHAVLMVLTDRGEFILDNKRDAVLPWNQTGYTYLKREGSDGLAWASLVGRLSPVTGDTSADLRDKASSSAPPTSSSTPASDDV